MKILAFGASYHKESINKELARYVSGFFEDENSEIKLLDLNAFQVPLFTVDLEAEIGHPNEVYEFISLLDWADFYIISMAEHNGAYTAAFKNLFDWASRVKLKMFENKKIFLLSTSPGGNAAQFVLEIAKNRFPRHGAEIIETFSLPSFNETYNLKEGIVKEDLKKDLLSKISNLKQKLS